MSFVRTINPNACQNVIAPNPKIVGTNQFQSNIVTQPNKKQISTTKMILVSIRSSISIQLEGVKKFLKLIICLYVMLLLIYTKKEKIFSNLL